MTVIGVDFGTTNSVATQLQPDGSVSTIRHAFGTADLDIVRSVLCFWNDGDHRHHVLRHAAGPAAIEAYLDDPLESRLMMSLKSYLAQRSFTETRVFGRTFTLEGLIGLFLHAILPEPGAALVAGRPVKFAGDSADDAFGEQRLRGSFAAAGWASVDTALEPEAAGYRFARGLDAPATVLIGDWGHERLFGAAVRARQRPSGAAARARRHRHRGRHVRLSHRGPCGVPAPRQGHHLPSGRH